MCGQALVIIAPRGVTVEDPQSFPTSPTLTTEAQQVVQSLSQTASGERELHGPGASDGVADDVARARASGTSGGPTTWFSKGTKTEGGIAQVPKRPASRAADEFEQMRAGLCLSADDVGNMLCGVLGEV